MMVDRYDIPEKLYYNKEHAWILIDKRRLAKIGITDYAQKMLREINFIYLPKKGIIVKRLEVFSTIESTKAISELYSPFRGEIIEVNEKLGERPRIINEDPYGEGWIITIRPSRLKEESRKLISAEQYAEYVQELTKIDKELLIYRWRKGATQSLEDI